MIAFLVLTQMAHYALGWPMAMGYNPTLSQTANSVETVEKHRQRLMPKLSIHDTAGLTRYAIAAGIIESRVQLTMV